MTKCYTCGTIYDGWSCPVCSAKEELEQKQKDMQRSMEESVKEQQADIKSAIEDASIEMEYAIEETAARHEKAISEAWKLQAEAKIDRAYELYRADLDEEVIKLCLEAISQDPGNIRAYKIAYWAYKATGQAIRAKDLLKKQIYLLRTSAYKNSEKQALRILQDILSIQDNKDFISSFVYASKDFGYFPASLIDELMKHSSYEDARQLFLNTMKYGEYLLGYTYGIEIDTKVLGKARLDKLNKCLKSVPYTQRNYIFETFENIKYSGRFSENTINLIREEILNRYDEWKPDIERAFTETASEKANKEADAKNSPLLGYVVGIIIFIILWNIWNSPIGRFGALLVAFTASIFIGSKIRSNIQRNIEAELITSMREKEEETLNSALLATGR